MVDYLPVKMLEYIRDGLIEEEHYGLFVKTSIDDCLQKLGDDKNYPFYLRSCAKPLQAALIIDFCIDKIFEMTNEEIAVCCSSHAGEECHVEIVKYFLDKIGIEESAIKCGFHKPLSKTEQNKLIAQDKTENILQNNCSGKHVMMLAICKKMSWNIDNYHLPEHPLQVEIKKKIYKLCEIKTNYPVTKDGCGVPIYSMPLENMVKGYLNLFLDEKYSKIKDAFIQHPYLIGGEGRFDTAIMTVNKNLIVKSGAGGICIVINLDKKEGFVIKIMDSDMKSRAICTIEALKQLGWLSEEMLNNDLVKTQNKTDILTLHGEKIGQAVPCFKF